MRAEDARPSARRWMRRLQFLLLASGALLWLAACMEGGAKVTGGTGSEAGDAYGEVWSIRGEKRAVAAQVRLYASAESLYAHPALRAETATDSAGRFHFPIAAAGSYDLEIHSGDGVELMYRQGLEIPARGATNLGVFHLAEAAAYRGRLPIPPAAPTTVWLAGTPFSAQADSAGRFAFPSLPPGDYPVFTERIQDGSRFREAFGSVELAPGDTLAPPDTLPVPPVVTPEPVDTAVPGTGGGADPADWSALIENFDDGGRQSAWGAAHGGGFWSIASSGVSRMVPATTSEFTSAVVLPAGHGGLGLEVMYRAEPLVQATASARLAMEKPLSPLLQRADTLCFWSRGDGQLVVDLHFAWPAAYGAPAPERRASATLNLSPAWREYKVPIVADTSASDDSWIRFTGTKGSLYYLDDILVLGKVR